MVDVAIYRRFHNERVAEHKILTKELSGILSDLKDSRRLCELLERAREVVNEVLSITQRAAADFVEEVVTLALSTVHGHEYRFELEFSIKRNQSEIVPWIVKDGERYSPREEVGGGILDVCALGLRLVFWALSEPRSSPLFILDEPGRWISADKQEAFGRLLREVCKKLGVQMIVVSHSPGIIESADRAYEVVQENGISKAILVEK